MDLGVGACSWLNLKVVCWLDDVRIRFQVVVALTRIGRVAEVSARSKINSASLLLKLEGRLLGD